MALQASWSSVGLCFEPYQTGLGASNLGALLGVEALLGLQVGTGRKAIHVDLIDYAANPPVLGRLERVVPAQAVKKQCGG